MLTPKRENVYVLGEQEYAIINRRFFRLTELSDDEIAEVFNCGEALPLFTKEQK